MCVCVAIYEHLAATASAGSAHCACFHGSTANLIPCPWLSTYGRARTKGFGGAFADRDTAGGAV